MKASLVTIGLVFCCAQIGFGQTNASLRPLLDQAASATGAEYIVVRNRLVAEGSNAVSELTAISTNNGERWQIRLVAGIVDERIQKGEAINALINRDWTREPEYDVKWERYRSGPVTQLTPLIIKRCKELGLWWHYMEVVWKETGEHSKKVHMREDYWRGAYRGACHNSPLQFFVLEVCKDRIRRDLGFRGMETYDNLGVLTHSKTNTVLPFLLEILPHIPVADERDRIDNVLKWTDTLAQPQDVPLIEESFRGRKQEVPEKLRARLNALRERGKAPMDATK